MHLSKIKHFANNIPLEKSLVFIIILIYRFEFDYFETSIKQQLKTKKEKSLRQYTCAVIDKRPDSTK